MSTYAVACDIGIIHPDAAGAGKDCLKTMYERKKRRREPFVDEMEKVGIVYEPIIFSAFGRPHEKAVTFMNNLARQIARRKGTEMLIERRRIYTKVSTEIWRRAAKMIRHCLPLTREDELSESSAAIPSHVWVRVGRPETVDLEAY